MPVSSASIDPQQILQLLLACLPKQVPELLAVYAFGSRVHGTQRADSDLDLAILVAGKADPVLLWDVAQHMASELGYDIDLLDLRAASTVMQYQIICSGTRLWASDARAAIYESFILSEKTALDALRAGLMADIQREGSVYGR